MHHPELLRWVSQVLSCDITPVALLASPGPSSPVPTLSVVSRSSASLPASPSDTSQEVTLTIRDHAPRERRAILMPLTALSLPLSLTCPCWIRSKILEKNQQNKDSAKQHKSSHTISIARTWIFAFYGVNLIWCQITLPRMWTAWQMKNKIVFRIW